MNYEDKTKQVLNLLKPDHYPEDMWKVALKMTNDQLEELDDIAKQLVFITNYVRTHS